ncbi:hypothetical protein CYMTET_34305 [Cymbomonas tetramitiformis]|uniref:Uncharacterized protein n=1 Tax=Cymbomonas tetramitiformis TaxID=36881 RepID=A0AAE0FBC1_9CHLO|nr:hypothetical protein CYMTET_34305 [Cymbomonas tetramitiformis]
MGPNPDEKEAARWEEDYYSSSGRLMLGIVPGSRLSHLCAHGCELHVPELAPMDRAWENAIEETDYATQDGHGGGTQGSAGTQQGQSGQASGGAGEAGGTSQGALSHHLSVQDILAEGEDLLLPGPERGTWSRAGSHQGRRCAWPRKGWSTCWGQAGGWLSFLRGLLARGGLVGRVLSKVWVEGWWVDFSDDHLQQVAQQHTVSHQLPSPRGEVAAVPELTVMSSCLEGDHRSGGRGEPTLKAPLQCAGGAVAEALRWPSEA